MCSSLTECYTPTMQNVNANDYVMWTEWHIVINDRISNQTENIAHISKLRYNAGWWQKDVKVVGSVISNCQFHADS
jgi:hypothetical protein